MFRLRSIVPRNTQNTQKFSSARKFCEFCGSTFQQEASVCSVNSVGRCNGCSVGAAETAAPPGWVRVAALNNPPTDGTDAHRCLGCALSHRTHRSLLLWEDAVAAWLVQFLVGWCSSCSGKRQSRAETSAPPGTAPLKGSVGMAGCHTLLQLHRLGGCPKISVRICDICGRISQQKVSVNSVNSVGR